MSLIFTTNYFRNSAGRKCLLGFLFLSALISCKSSQPINDSWVVSPPMTVVDIFQFHADIRVYKIAFRESARTYTFNAEVDHEEVFFDLLDESLRKKTRVIITRGNDQSTEIIRVEKAK